MGKVVEFPKSVWTRERILRDELYRLHDDRNPLYVLWKLFRWQGAFFDGAAVPGEYVAGALAILERYGDLRDREDFMEMALGMMPGDGGISGPGGAGESTALPEPAQQQRHP